MKATEILVLILMIIVISAGVVLYYGGPGYVRPKTDAIMMANNGRQIMLGVFAAAEEADSICSGDIVWPEEGQYKTSTEFFRSVFTNKYVRGIDFSFFGANGIPATKNKMDPHSFSAINNAWGVVCQTNNGNSCDFVEKHPTTPFLFSRNIGFGPNSEPARTNSTIADMNGLRKGTKPFGNKIGIIITFGGSVKILKPADATQPHINPDGLNLPVITP